MVANGLANPLQSPRELWSCILFIPEGASAFPDAAGHYSKAGNQVIAGYLERHLAAILHGSSSTPPAGPETSGE